MLDTVSTWWTVAGRHLAVDLVAAVLVAAIAVRVGRRISTPTPWRVDLATYGFALALCGAVAVVLRFVGIAPFTGAQRVFFPAGLAFYACGVVVPAWLAIRAARENGWARAAVASAPILLAAAMLTVEPNRLEVRRETIELATLPTGASIRIAHLSDVQTIGICERDREAARAVAAFDPDFSVLTGDLVGGRPMPTVVSGMRAWLSGLAGAHGVFVVNGDSDADFEPLVADLPRVTWLCDRGVDLDVRGARLHVAGLDHRLPHDAAAALARAPSGATRILLAHSPDSFVEGSGWDAELGLAGHTHGGQVQLPGFGAIWTATAIGRRYDRGVFRGMRARTDFPWRVDVLSICGGLGMEGGFAPRVRLLCPPQVLLLTLVAAAAR
ncbi:MAG TPA: hypothetical protein VKE69_01855 [Planctomycetota bacterium]|nr:hypothetical protein [Planctomycetota bacterium]